MDFCFMLVNESKKRILLQILVKFMRCIIDLIIEVLQGFGRLAHTSTRVPV